MMMPGLVLLVLILGVLGPCVAALYLFVVLNARR